jgi:hypothetical protein
MEEIANSDGGGDEYEFSSTACGMELHSFSWDHSFLEMKGTSEIANFIMRKLRLSQ